MRFSDSAERFLRLCQRAAQVMMGLQIMPLLHF